VLPSDAKAAEPPEGVAVVYERPAKGSGEVTWQAEILSQQPGVNHTGRPRTFTIRGPPRKVKEAADADAEQLTQSAHEGGKVLRSIANEMHKRK